jgi:hypothetical protein
MTTINRFDIKILGVKIQGRGNEVIASAETSEQPSDSY